MELGTLSQWGSVAASLIALVVAALANSKKGLDDRFAALVKVIDERFSALSKSGVDADKKTAELEDRVIKIERDMQHLPDKESSHRMELAITELKGDIAIMTERLKPVASISERLQEFLLDQARK